VIDDGSSDDTALIARKFEGDRRVFVHTQPNGGPAAARNRGIRFARGEFVAFLDSDDLLLPTYLDEMGRALAADEGSALAFTDAWSLDDDTGEVHIETAMEASAPPDPLPRERTELLTLLTSGNFILASALVRRKVLEEAGGYDPATTGAEDYDLWLRIVIAGHHVTRVPGLLVVQRESGSSFSKDLPRLFGALRDIYTRLAADDSLPDQVRAVARERAAWNAAHVDSLTRSTPGAVLARRLRRRAASVRRRVRPPATYDETPDELVRAFGDLRDL
jgi:glycosyltransferase involved in cell wall biosynthesis